MFVDKAANIGQYPSVMKIPLESTINDELILVSSSCTTFIHEINLKTISLVEFRFNVRALAKKCKENKVKFSRKGEKFFNENYSDYLAAMDEYRKLFFDLKRIAEEIVEKGIESPVVENELLKKARPVVARMNELCFSSSAISRCRAADIYAKQYLNKDFANYGTIYI